MKRNKTLPGIIIVIALAVVVYSAIRILEPKTLHNVVSNQITNATTHPTTTHITTTTMLQTPIKLRLLFLPVDWTSGMQAFNATADKHAEEVIKNIPLSSCPGAVEIIKINKNCNVNYTSDPNSCNTERLNLIADCAKATGLDYDYAIGMGDTSVCGNTDGYSEGIKTIYVEGQVPIVTVHELGHEWGLNDEYINACNCGYGLVNSNSNCLDAALNGSDPVGRYSRAYCAGGNRCPPRYDVTCQGNMDELGGRCIMSYADAPEPRAFCSDCMDHLKTIPNLTCSN